MTPLDYALAYAAHGWQVFPVYPPINGRCSCKSKSCTNAGKHPRVKWGTLATTNTDTIKGWWQQWPDANIGIATGARSNLVVLDVDGGEGEATIAANGGIDTPNYVTTKQGRHIYFAHPGIPVQNFVKRAGLDVRGDGGYVVAPPSVHASGIRYAWAAPLEGL